MVHRARSFVVRMDRSISPTCSSAGTVSLEFHACVYVHDVETALFVKLYDLVCFSQHGVFLAVVYVCNGTELDLARYGM